MDEFFLWKRYKNKSSDAPWMTPQIKRWIKARKKAYKKEKRSQKWRDLKEETVELVRAGKKKFRRRIWIIRHLKQAQVPPCDLLDIYKAFLLPVIDYASTVYHSMLTKDQASRLERLQSGALKVIYGWREHYHDLLEDHQIESIHERRQRMTDKFILKAAKHPRFRRKWFQTKTFTHHDLRRELFFEEKFARTDRLYNAPIYYYRRRLNEIYSPDEDDEL